MINCVHILQPPCIHFRLGLEFRVLELSVQWAVQENYFHWKYLKMYELKPFVLNQITVKLLWFNKYHSASWNVLLKTEQNSALHALLLGFLAGVSGLILHWANRVRVCRINIDTVVAWASRVCIMSMTPYPSLSCERTSRVTLLWQPAMGQHSTFVSSKYSPSFCPNWWVHLWFTSTDSGPFLLFQWWEH